MDTNDKAISRSQQRTITSQKRHSMKPIVLSFILSQNKLSKTKKLFLYTLRQESKFYYNYLLSLSQTSIVDNYGNIVYPHDLFLFDTKNNHISVYNSINKTHEPYTLTVLSSQIKQKILDKLLDNIKGLSEKKKNGVKVGQLKYKASINIPFKQFNNTYYLDDDFKYLCIQGNSKEFFKLNPNKALNKLSFELGFEKLSINDLLDKEIIEIANSELIYKNHKYVFNLTIYINPVVFNKNTQKPLIDIIKPDSEYNNIYKPYKKVRSNINRNPHNVPLKTLSKIIKNSYSSLNHDNKEEIISFDKNFNDFFVQLGETNKLNSSIKEYGYIKQFHMNLTEEQLGLLSNTFVGLDAGIADEITMNCGEINNSFSINSRDNIYLNAVLKEIKHTQTQLNYFIARSKKLNKKDNINSYNKSQTYYSIKDKLNKLWTKYDNIKTNMVNHIVSFLKNFKVVCFQEEMISKWKQDKLKGYGKKIQQGILGKVYAKLKLLNKENPKKYIMLSRNIATTKLCPICDVKNPVKLKDRTYKCGCGYENNRDCHSGFNMLYLGGIISKKEVINMYNCFKNKVSGIDSVNLVKLLTSMAKTTKEVFEVVLDKLVTKCHINSKLSCYENTAEASSFMAT